MSATSQNLETQRARCNEHGQAHLLAHWDKLDEAGRERLLGAVADLDLDFVDRAAALLGGEPSVGEGAPEPAELFPLDRGPAQVEEAASAVARGESLLRDGKVGYLLVAGGQASRLGYDGPKGTFPVGPLTGRTLFGMHAHALRRTAERYGTRTPWYVMTSPANDADTRAFFEEHGHFGLDPADVFFFSQAMNPAVDLDGRALLASEDSLFMAPNGHGGVLSALRDSGALDDAAQRGLEQLSYFQVDNPMVPPADRLFLGLHAQAGAGMSSKAVAKRDAHEKVGVLATQDGTLGIIEYSDLPDELREARDEEGLLRFRAGSIAVHVLDLGFVGKITGGGLNLPIHVARKTMKVWTPEGPREVKGAKFETFVFDALAQSESSVTLEVDRADEFSPVKNGSGDDSPETCRADLVRRWGRWLEGAGMALPGGAERGESVLEIDPLLAEDAESFAGLANPTSRECAGGQLFD